MDIVWNSFLSKEKKKFTSKKQSKWRLVVTGLYII